MTRRIPAPAFWTRLSRRLKTLITAAVLFTVLIVLFFTVSVPYVILSPGPTYNTLGKDDGGNQIIVINGAPANQTTGNLNMTTVNVTTGRVDVFQAFVGWLKSDQVVVPRASVFPPGVSQQQVQQQNAADFTESQDNATAAAFCELGYPKGFGIVMVKKGGPSDGKLHPADTFTSINGTAVSDYKSLADVLGKQTPGTTVPVVVQRGGRPVTVQVTLGPAAKGRTGATLGVSVSSGNACLAPFEVDLGLGNQIGGPSAGLMFALGIIDKVGHQDITHGRFIAGTGTIDPTGKVGAIGGIQLKMIAARRAGATVFLAPSDNCGDVRGAIPHGLNVVKVDTLQHALDYLADLQQNKPVPHC